MQLKMNIERENREIIHKFQFYSIFVESKKKANETERSYLRRSK